jgi:hypothetical protein
MLSVLERMGMGTALVQPQRVNSADRLVAGSWKTSSHTRGSIGLAHDRRVREDHLPRVQLPSDKHPIRVEGVALE